MSHESALAAFATRLLTPIVDRLEDEITNYETWQHQFLEKRLRLSLWLALLVFLSFIALNLICSRWGLHFLNPNELLSEICVVLSVLTCLTLLQTPWGRSHLGWIFLSAAWAISLIPRLSNRLDDVVAPDIGVSWVMAFFTQATLMPVRWPLHLVSQLSTFAVYFGIRWMLGLQLNVLQPTPAYFFLTLFWLCLICNLAVYLYERLTRSAFHILQKLDAEQERSERLLLNILPQTIAERLKHSPQVIADSFPAVTVLFADLVGFTQFAERMPPPEVVALLNQIFSMFDQLAERHGLEKIKTIGDAYMVVAGLPEPRDDHADAIAQMALDMQQALIQFNQQTGQVLAIRIGIHTGPVVAGVIGLKKFVYDLWGDTVNTASRMESHGIPGCIQVTEATYECLKEHYQFEKRGLILVKGKGQMMTYLLIGKRKFQNSTCEGE
ncbi:MAG TPA: adenylate/guanylate cyclase domain-containing protein [Chroococcales cyanobacterium]|jgi:class 3 adenylate cyclase